MKSVVIYKSKTGFTRQYAQWIAEALSCEALPMNKVNMNSIREYDTIIYGGWILGGMVMGLDKVRKMQPKQLVIFATGASVPCDITEQGIKEASHIDNEPFFYMEAGFRFEQLGFFKKMMLKMVKKSVAKKENKTEQDQYMEKVLGTSFDNSNKTNINPLVEYVQGLD